MKTYDVHFRVSDDVRVRAHSVAQAARKGQRYQETLPKEERPSRQEREVVGVELVADDKDCVA